MNFEPQLKTRSDIHLARKIWHFSGVMTIAVFYHILSRSQAIQTLTIISAICIFIDVYRQRSATLNRVVLSITRLIIRENEKNNLAGSTYLFIGILIIVALFPPSIVTLSLLFLATADPIASYFGVRYGKDRLIGRKTLQGSMAAFFACTAVAAGYFFMQNTMTDRLLIVSILAGFIGAVAEALPVGNLDDNLVLPVASSALLWVVYFFFGGF
jgi:diacylglycerol kinase (CTP)